MAKAISSIRFRAKNGVYQDHYPKKCGTLVCIVPNITLSLFQQVGNRKLEGKIGIQAPYTFYQNPLP
jgi:hypothetical protein